MWKMPEVTEWAKEMNAHEPTRSYGEEIHNLVNNWLGWAGDRCDALEVGAAWGVSALAILTVHPDIYLTSVDSDPTVKAVPEIKANKLGKRWEFINKTSKEFFESNTHKFDLVYIDGSHKYPTCRDDYISAWEALEEGGLFIADDFKDHRNQRVDTDGTTVEYGTSLGLWELIEKYKITKIGTTTRLFWTIK